MSARASRWQRLREDPTRGPEEHLSVVVRVRVSVWGKWEGRGVLEYWGNI